MAVTWNDPKTKLPEERERVLFKIVILHNQKIKYGRYEDGSFYEADAGGISYDKKDVFGWVPFTDSQERK